MDGKIALIECPDCNGVVSKRAAFCPHCGRPGENRLALSVAVRDLDMKFESMVGFMIKAALAAIPAMLVLAMLGFIILAVLGGLGSVSK